jgi:choline dehydrogenase-like flavoprotein
VSAPGADVVVVGAGISGALVARQCLEAGLQVTMVERGGMRTHAEQMAGAGYETDGPGARHNHETAPGTPDYPWDYVFGVGGASLHWSGHTPRLLPTDFRMRSTYGVMEDWPIDYDALVPYFERAEDALAVAGGPGGQPAHPLSPMDRAVAGLLDPFHALPQARPSRDVGTRPACCGAAICALCPVDSRFSVLNACADVLEHPALDLRTDTVAARVRVGAGRATGIDVLGPDGAPGRIDARAVILAASGFENPAILLRSGLDRPATGRFLFDHRHRTLWVRVREPVGAGHGATISTGYSAALLDGPFRARHSGAVAVLFNPGVPVVGTVADALLEGARGRSTREAAADVWQRTLPFDLLLEDVPRPERRVTLSPRRDHLGLPLVRVAYADAGEYEAAGYRAAVEELTRRLEPLGVEAADERPAPAGGHLLGTCRTGEGETAVVGPDLRHLDTDGLFVVGGSAFPTYSPLHPTLTIAALAIRAGDRVAAELG